MFIVKEYDYDNSTDDPEIIERSVFPDILNAICEMNRQADQAVEAYENDGYHVSRYTCAEELMTIVTDDVNEIDFAVEYRDYQNNDYKLPNLSNLAMDYAMKDVYEKNQKGTPMFVLKSYTFYDNYVNPVELGTFTDLFQAIEAMQKETEKLLANFDEDVRPIHKRYDNAHLETIIQIGDDVNYVFAIERREKDCDRQIRNIAGISNKYVLKYEAITQGKEC